MQNYLFPFLFLSFGLFSSLSAQFLINDIMTREEQHKTGLDRLNANQRLELEDWMNKNFILKEQKEAPPEKEVTLSLNIREGEQLRMSDGSLYEVAPSDVNRAALWITPFPMKITDSGDPDYPSKLTNTTTGTSIKAKMIEPPNS